MRAPESYVYPRNSTAFWSAEIWLWRAFTTSLYNTSLPLDYVYGVTANPQYSTVYTPHSVKTSTHPFGAGQDIEFKQSSPAVRRRRIECHMHAPFPAGRVVDRLWRTVVRVRVEHSVVLRVQLGDLGSTVLRLSVVLACRRGVIPEPTSIPRATTPMAVRSSGSALHAAKKRHEMAPDAAGA
jgi:hypothetical protein